MSRKAENAGFICANCGETVVPVLKGGYRNHCTACLCSVHIDIEPGDRQSDCLGLMTPEEVRYNTQKGWQILHKCRKCGFSRYNMVMDDDNMEKFYKLMQGNINFI